MKKNLPAGKKSRSYILVRSHCAPVNLHVSRLQIASHSEVLHTDNNNHFKN
jgi:hypothetical protein